MARFSEALMEHARYPKNLGRDELADRIGRADFGGSPPQIEFYLRLDQGKITKASFEAAGCGVTIGACSALVEMIVGIDATQAVKIDAVNLSKKLEGVPGDKEFCLNVAIAALRDALKLGSATA